MLHEFVIAFIRSISFCITAKSSFIESRTVVTESKAFLVVKRRPQQHFVCFSMSTSFIVQVGMRSNSKEED